MSDKGFLEGFIPYPEDVVKAHRDSGAWLDLTYGDLLDRAFARFPDKTAVIDDHTRLTYAEFKEKANRFAIALMGLGVKGHDRIVLQLPNRCEFMIAYYAMQRIGAVPVISVPRHGLNEILNFIRSTDAVGWIVPLKDGKYDFLPLIQGVRQEEHSLRYLIIPGDGKALPSGACSMNRLIDEVNLEEYPADYLDPFRPDPDDVAVLIPTGGTTGLPKLVPRTHNSIIVINHFTSKKLTPDHVLLQATPAGHSAAISGSLNQAVFLGATLVLQGVPRAAEILETIQREKVTFAIFVPTQLEGIMNHPELEKYDLSSMRFMTSTGAKIHQELTLRAMEYFGRFGCIGLGSGLGASEGLLALSDPDESIEIKMNTVGKNVTPGSHYKVIDGKEQALPPGKEGELVAKGPEVFTGYYMATEADNRNVFTHDGYYKTGDLAVIDERGFITITGRRKDTIIRGGETLIPHDMENLIVKHPAVDQAAVIGMPDARLGEKACAYVVTKPGRSLTFEEMIDFLKSQGAGVLLLPERLEIIDGLPETNVGKIDKKALRSDIEGKLKQEEE